MTEGWAARYRPGSGGGRWAGVAGIARRYSAGTVAAASDRNRCALKIFLKIRKHIHILNNTNSFVHASFCYKKKNS